MTSKKNLREKLQQLKTKKGALNNSKITANSQIILREDL